jgi:hypothetical protein
MPGFCGGISLGSWFDLDRLVREGVDLEKHVVLKFIINEDMKSLFHFANHMKYKEMSDGYVSKCHLCLDIRKHLSASGNFEELSPKEFYKHLGL